MVCSAQILTVHAYSEKATFWKMCISAWPNQTANLYGLRQSKVRLVFPQQSMSVCHFSGSPVEIIFTENKMKWGEREKNTIT